MKFHPKVLFDICPPWKSCKHNNNSIIEWPLSCSFICCCSMNGTLLDLMKYVIVTFQVIIHANSLWDQRYPFFKSSLLEPLLSEALAVQYLWTFFTSLTFFTFWDHNLLFILIWKLSICNYKTYASFNLTWWKVNRASQHRKVQKL